MFRLDPPPPPPPESSWTFVDELREPLWTSHPWTPKRRRANEADLGGGVTLAPTFPDPETLLQTATQDLVDFFQAGKVPLTGAYRIVTDHAPDLLPEAYRITVAEHECRIGAADTEGIRRAIFHLEDEMLRREGPLLPLGTIEREPVIRTRLSRCFFGPIKRAPRNRDELTDDVDYYPDHYLNRLAHDGVNGLWLTIEWKDVCRTRVIPEYGADADRRLAKLRRTVQKCRRYGIRIYTFFIEPAAFKAGDPLADKYPDLAGNRANGWINFCPGTDLGKRYIREAMTFLFTQVPNLGGIINISVGEHATHCVSGSERLDALNCPRCADRDPCDVLADVLRAMADGVHAAAPGAEIISWPYSQYVCWGDARTTEAAGRLPEGVMLQHNFESTGTVRQLGKVRDVCDYSLAYAGPAALFERCAEQAVTAGSRMSAKLQVGCSHEVATVPWVPVPGLVYEKYRAMHRLGVSGAMQSWYFGNYPSLMTRAAGDLSFAPFAEDKDAFLDRLARRDWGRHAPAVTRAWKHFERGYRQYPMIQGNVHYNPVSDGPVWPLYLVPRDIPLSQPWKFGTPPSGDRIGELVSYSHTLDETIELFDRVAKHWEKGVAILNRLRSEVSDQPERLREIGVAAALGIQFRSGVNILRFYRLRDRLPNQERDTQREILDAMRRIVHCERDMDRELKRLAEQDSRLGFHSEAEGHKVFPDLIAWRLRHLDKLLAEEFPDVEAQIERGEPLFTAYTGADTTRHMDRSAAMRDWLADPNDVLVSEDRPRVCLCRRFSTAPALDRPPVGGAWERCEAQPLTFRETFPGEDAAPCEEEPGTRETWWRAGYDGGHLYIGILCREPRMPELRADQRDRALDLVVGNDVAGVEIAPRRLWPAMRFAVNPAGARGQILYGTVAPPYAWQAGAWQGADRWSVILRFPLSLVDRAGKKKAPLLMDVVRHHPLPGGPDAREMQGWVARHPLLPRLALGTANPANLGWLVFEEPRHA